MPTLALLVDVLDRTEATLQRLTFKLTELVLLLAAGRAPLAVRAADEVELLHEHLGMLEIEREVRTADLAATLGISGSVTSSQLLDSVPAAFRLPFETRVTRLRTLAAEVERLVADAHSHASVDRTALVEALAEVAGFQSPDGSLERSPGLGTDHFTDDRQAESVAGSVGGTGDVRQVRAISR